MRSAVVTAVIMLAAAGCSSPPEPDAEVVMTEMAIAGPAQLDAGVSVWEVVNQGETHHNLSVCPGRIGTCAGPNIDQRVLRKDPTARDPQRLPDVTDALVLGAGWNNLVEVDLEPGEYRLWCGVPNHAVKGMDANLTVR